MEVSLLTKQHDDAMSIFSKAKRKLDELVAKCTQSEEENNQRISDLNVQNIKIKSVRVQAFNQTKKINEFLGEE